MTRTESSHTGGGRPRDVSSASRHDSLPKGYHLLAKRLGRLVAQAIIKSNRRDRNNTKSAR